MRIRLGSEMAIVIVLSVLAAGLVSLKWLLRASEREGIPLFSRQTWEETKWYFIFAAAYIGVRLIWVFATRARSDSSEEK
jgi:hypothetical protein